MYIVSEPKSLSDPQIQAHVKEETGSWPPGYLDFLRRVGQGTYRGWMNVQIPDPEVLKPFAEYGLWEFDADSPITEQQIGDCIAIGTTVDGDFLAVHPQTAQLIWLPRHEEYLRVISLLQAGEQDHEWPYAMVLDEIYRQVYGSSQEGVVYYDPWTGTRNHFFLQLPPGQNQLSLPELAGMCRAAFLPDQSHENPYTCSLFYQKLGGYVRFNYANRQEVAVFYEQGAQQAVTVMKQWLLSKGCRGEV